MKGMTVTVLGDAPLLSLLGKKGTSTDITFYNLKKGTTGITYLEPSRYPEKLQPLMQALGMSEGVILSIEKIDKTAGEMIVAIDAVGVKHGYIILRNYLQADQLAPFIKGTCLEKYPVIERDFNRINDLFVGMELPPADGPLMVPIDHFFNVKGVGTVALGTVKRGLARPHDSLEVYPLGKKALVRSIQVHDEDVPEAGFGNRVGLALKGIEAEELERGVIMAPPGSLQTPERIELEITVNKYWKGLLSKGMVLHLSCGLQIVPAQAEEVPGDGAKPGTTARVSFKLNKPLACFAGCRIIGLDLDSKGLRIIGWGTLG